MSFIFAGLILTALVGISIFFYGVIADIDNDKVVMGGLVLFMAPIILICGILAIGLAFGISSSPPLMEGACYRAVRHTTTTYIPVGKVIVPSTTSGIDLEQIVCP